MDTFLRFVAAGTCTETRDLTRKSDGAVWAWTAQIAYMGGVASVIHRANRFGTFDLQAPVVGESYRLDGQVSIQGSQTQLVVESLSETE